MKTMKYEAAINLIDDALKDIKTGEGLVGEALTEDTAALCAAIAQAKLLAVIASTLVEIKDTYIHQAHPGL